MKLLTEMTSHTSLDRSEMNNGRSNNGVYGQTRQRNNIKCRINPYMSNMVESSISVNNHKFPNFKEEINV